MLITMYEDNFSTLLVSPVCDELRTNIDDVFVDLVLCNDVLHKKVQEGVRSEGDEVALERYRDIFFKENKLCKNIYMLGNAGMGKTTWCTKLLRTWVVAQKKLSEGKAEMQDLDEDHKCMLNFDIVVFVPLRHATDDSLILEMVENQLFSEIPEKQSILVKVMAEEPSKCLIVLDGLDEWSKPPGKKFSFSQNQNIPGRKGTHGCPVLTTSRPWKIYSIGLKESEIDRAVKLKGIKDKDLMAQKMIYKLNNLLREDDPKEYKDFDKCMKDFQELDKVASLPFDKKLPLSDFMNVPLILVIMVCLWFHSGKIEASYAGNYWAMVGYLIQYTETQKELTKYEEKAEHYQVLKKCPEMVRGHVHKYMRLITKLSKIAFEAVFKNGLNSNLVFDESTLEKVLSKAEVHVAVQLGILSQSKAIGQALSKMTSLSFLHKSLQEFFAAMHIVLTAHNNKLDALQTFEKHCSDAIKIAEMENIVLFVCGLDPKIASRISLHIANLEISQTRENENDNLYMYITYNLPLKCAIQVHAFDKTYPSTEFPIHTKHVFVENSEQFKPILSFLFSILKANIRTMTTITINTGMMHESCAIKHLECRDHKPEKALAKEQPDILSLPQKQPNTLSLPLILMEQSGLPVQLKNCTLYGLDLSDYSDNELRRVEKSLKRLVNIEVLNIGKIRGFELLQLNLSNCRAMTFFSLQDMRNTHVELNLKTLQMVSLEKGFQCRIYIVGKDNCSCMHEKYKKDCNISIVARKMIECTVKLCFSCILVDKLIVEDCLRHSIDFDKHRICQHLQVSVNEVKFDNNNSCSMTGTEEIIADNVFIKTDKGRALHIPVEQVVKHAKSIRVHRYELHNYMFDSSRMEYLEITLSENERKDLDIICNNLCKLLNLLSLNIQAYKVDPSHVLIKVVPKLSKLKNVEIQISEENFSRNAWTSLFESLQSRNASYKLTVNDTEHRSISCTRDESENIDIYCTRLHNKDLKSMFSIISKKLEAKHVRSIDIQANTVDISIFRIIQKLTSLEMLKINMSNYQVTPSKSIVVESKHHSLHNISCRYISGEEFKIVVNSLSLLSSLKHIETIERFSFECEEMDELIYKTFSKIRKVQSVFLKISKDCTSESTEQQVLNYLMSVDSPGYSSVCIQIGDNKLLNLEHNSLKCKYFSEGDISSVLSFVARPNRYERLLTTLDVHSSKIDTQFFKPLALLKKLASLKLTLTTKVIHDKVLEALRSTVKSLPKLHNLHVDDGSFKCIVCVNEASFDYARGRSCRITIKPQMDHKYLSQNVSAHLEVECVKASLEDFKWVVTMAASHPELGNSRVKVVRYKAETIEKGLPFIGYLSQFAGLIAKLTEEQYLQGDWLKAV